MADAGRPHRLNIIGCGRAAGSLADGWSAAGAARIGGICNRSLDSADLAADRLGQGHAHEEPGTMGRADLWMVGVPDAAIGPVADQLAATSHLEDAVVFHLAGALGVDSLSVLRDAGARTAAVHPLKAFNAHAFDAEGFAGAWCIAEGDPSALEILEPLFSGIGGRWQESAIGNRDLYHAAAALASNGPRGLVHQAIGWLRSAGLDEESAYGVASSLLLDTARDLQQRRPALGLTGPMERGDEATIRGHLAAVGAQGDSDAALYRAVARSLLQLAAGDSRLDADAAKRLSQLLQED